MYGVLLVLHVLAATVWTGGHLVLALTVLPRVLREKSVAELERFESGFERIGIPALIIQVVTGLMLAHQMMPDVTQWFAFRTPVSHLICTKIGLLVVTVALAADARLRIIPNLTVDRLGSLAWHIIAVTVVSVLFVVVGVSLRAGWF
jgi:putative copper export protein